jgi:flagellar motor protein MotB
MTSLLVFMVGMALPATTSLPNQSAVAQTSTDDFAASQEAKANQNLADARAALKQKEKALSEIEALEKQKENVTSAQEQQDLDSQIAAQKTQVKQFDNQIDELEKQSIALYTVDPALKAKLYSIEKQLIEKYINNSSQTYIGNNPVEVVNADLLTRSMVFLVDPDKVSANGSNLPSEKSIDGIPVKVVQSKIHEASCSDSTRNGVCRPLKGGVSVSNQYALSVNTLSYKATVNGVVGFVIAGHTAGQGLNNIVQPYNIGSDLVGQVQAICFDSTLNGCDMAWVAPASGISVDNTIYGSGDGPLYTWVVDSYTAKSGQTPGSYAYFSGVTSGIVLTTVNGNSPNWNYAVLNGPAAQGGDSGAPVFHGHDGTYATIYGEIIQYGGTWSFYEPEDYIQTTIGAVPSTS